MVGQVDEHRAEVGLEGLGDLGEVAALPEEPVEEDHGGTVEPTSVVCSAGGDVSEVDGSGAAASGEVTGAA